MIALSIGLAMALASGLHAQSQLVSPDPQRGLLVVYRESAVFGVAFESHVIIERQHVGSVGSGGFYAVLLQPGEHLVYIVYGPDVNAQEIGVRLIELAAGDVHCLDVTPRVVRKRRNAGCMDALEQVPELGELEYDDSFVPNDSI